MGYTGNPNILFRLSGIQGDYTFNQNPESMSVLRFKNYNNKLVLLAGEDIHQHALLDNEVRVMSWSVCDWSLYTGLKPFEDRSTLGNIKPCYFWDGTVNEFRGDPIHVISVHIQPMAQLQNKFTLELQFKPIQV